MIYRRGADATRNGAGRAASSAKAPAEGDAMSYYILTMGWSRCGHAHISMTPAAGFDAALREAAPGSRRRAQARAMLGTLADDITAARSLFSGGLDRKRWAVAAGLAFTGARWAAAFMRPRRARGRAALPHSSVSGRALMRRHKAASKASPRPLPRLAAFPRSLGFRNRFRGSFISRQPCARVHRLRLLSRLRIFAAGHETARLGRAPYYEYGESHRFLAMKRHPDAEHATPFALPARQIFACPMLKSAPACVRCL